MVYGGTSGRSRLTEVWADRNHKGLQNYVEGIAIAAPWVTAERTETAQAVPQDRRRDAVGAGAALGG